MFVPAAPESNDLMLNTYYACTLPELYISSYLARSATRTTTGFGLLLVRDARR